MLKIGHRGAPGYTPLEENTIKSFKNALLKGADAVELDVRSSKDKKLVVTHNSKICGTLLKDLSLAQIRQTCPSMPILEEVCSAIGTRCYLNVEPREYGLVSHIAEIANSFNLATRIIVSAFDVSDNSSTYLYHRSTAWSELTYLRQWDIPFALLATARKVKDMTEREFVRAAINLGATAINPHYSTVSPFLVALAHANGLLVYTWVVNERIDIARMRACGVDGIISDYPERL